MKISISTLRRLPVYLNYLKQLDSSRQYISATAIAAALRYGDVQVRKDLGAVSGAGKPKVGYDRAQLIKTLESYLGYTNRKKAVLVGAGKLGRALMCYSGFKDYGLDMVAAFDVKPGEPPIDGRPVRRIDELESFCKSEKIKIGVITVPYYAAQDVADTMYKSGIKAIWNFAPVHLDLPQDVLVHDENMAASLALLTRELEDSGIISD